MKSQRKTLFWLAAATLVATVAFGFAGCKSKQDSQQAAIAQQDTAGVDPADANLAPAAQTSGQTQVLDQNAAYAPQQDSENYAQEPSSGYNDNPDAYADNTAYDQASEPPPPLPEYDQPAPPGPDWYWTPGYWSWGQDGYYWVPGTWVEPPYYGALWTPPYWGWYGGHYRFHHGYWGAHVGFYGGIDYGFGYIGIGYYGGYWRGHDFYYNRAVTNSGNVGNYYNRPVVVNNVHYSARPSNRVSYNGGNGGLRVQPRPQEVAAMHEHHTAPIAAQAQVRQAAVANRANFYSQNHGNPEHAAFARPEAAGVVAGRQAARPSGEPMRPAEAVRPGEVNRPGEPAHSDRMMPGGTVAHPNNRPVEMQRPAEVQRTVQTEPAHGENRPETLPPTREARPQQAPRQPMDRPQEAPRQQHMEAPRPQPQQHMEAPRPEPQQRMEAPRPQPAPHVEAPRPVPAPHAEAPHPAPAAHPEADGHEEHR
jgi:hypothetical protein